MKVINIVNLFYLIVYSHMYAKQPLTVILPHQYASFLTGFEQYEKLNTVKLGRNKRKALYVQVEGTVQFYLLFLTHFASRVEFFSILYFF